MLTWLFADVSEANREKRAAEERNRRAVALSVCHLLLGRAEEAEAALGLEPGAALKCDRAVLQFIKVGAVILVLLLIQSKWLRKQRLCPLTLYI